MVIWKWNLPLTASATISLPEGAKVLTVDMQRDQLRVWALVDPTAPLIPRIFFIVGTGEPRSDLEGATFLATIQRGAVVTHVFER